MTATREPHGRRRAGDADTVASAVARRVRTLRQARGWSLDELALRSGVSKGMVVQIENAKTNPSLNTLCRLAESFGVSISRLVESESEPAVRVVAADEPPTLWHGSRGGTARLLYGVTEPANVEYWDWRLPPGEHRESGDHTPGTRELIHVRAGELTVTVDGTAYRVAEGETIDLLGDRPHGYANMTDHEALATMIVMMPAVERDRRT